MEIKSAVFVKGSPSAEGLFDDGLPHIAFIGRSNVGKSTTINALTKSKSLAKTSSTPGRTREINLFLVNNKFYIVDLPGYGFAKGSVVKRDELHQLIENYLFKSIEVKPKVVLIIDAKVGPTNDDLDILETLEVHGIAVVVAVNKVDRLKSSELKKQLNNIQKLVGGHQTVPYSAEKKTNVGALWVAILK